MGLKSGSRDAGLDDSTDDDGPEERDREEVGAESEPTRATEPDTTRSSDREATQSGETGSDRAAERKTAEAADPDRSREPGPEASSTDQRPTANSIPYKLRRDKVNEGREQVPYFLREDVVEAEDELQDALEEMLGEDVYKSDYREASMIVAQRNPELVAEVLREWGYDLDAI